MAEETQSEQNSQNVQSPRRDAPRHQGGQRHHTYRDQAPRPAEKPREPKEPGLDDEETEQDRSSAPSRPSRGGRGRPPRRVIEEWASDIYCE